MSLDQYIEETILSHSRRSSIKFTEEAISFIKMHIKSGDYAFHLLYEPLTHTTPDFLCVIKKITPIDWRLVKSEVVYDNDGVGINTMWSHGGFFNFGSRETLVFDITRIREIKLNQIFNK